MDAGQACAQTSVAFIGGNGDRAAVGDKKVRAGDAHLGGEECFAQLAPRQRD